MGYELITNAQKGDMVYDFNSGKHYVYFGDHEWLCVGNVLSWYLDEDFEPNGEYEKY